MLADLRFAFRSLVKAPATRVLPTRVDPDIALRSE
jgi:hypothetical protein